MKLLPVPPASAARGSSSTLPLLRTFITRAHTAQRGALISTLSLCAVLAAYCLHLCLLRSSRCGASRQQNEVNCRQERRFTNKEKARKKKKHARAEEERWAGLDFRSHFLCVCEQNWQQQRHNADAHYAESTGRGAGGGSQRGEKNYFLQPKREELRLLPLMRVPVTSLCTDRANLTSPRLQRLAQPVMLAASRDTAGSAQPQRPRVRASPPPRPSRSFPRSPLAERRQPQQERALCEPSPR